VAVVRRQLGIRSVGHTGTLDPFATGLLIVLVGRATRLARFLADQAKTYDATVRFGVATSTDDGTGEVVRTVIPAAWPEHDAIDVAAQEFVGQHLQRPPVFSAKHVAGERSHALARAGRSVELSPVEVTVYQVQVGEWSPPDLHLVATVGSGTYLRALARDLGERLDLPAHCAALRRTRIGAFDAEAAVHPEEAGADRLLTPGVLMGHLPVRALSEAEQVDVGFGRDVVREFGEAAMVSLVGADGRLVAVAEARDDRWHPVVVLEPAA
jgi:tRNA pseudouridine55 synthase